MARWALLALCGIAAIVEMRGHRIPDWLCALGVAAGVIWNLEPSFAGAATALVVGLPFWMLYQATGGHLKLLVAAGSLTGWQGAVLIAAVAAILTIAAAVLIRWRPSGSLAVLCGAGAWIVAQPWLQAGISAATHP